MAEGSLKQSFIDKIKKDKGPSLGIQLKTFFNTYIDRTAITNTNKLANNFEVFLEMN